MPHSVNFLLEKNWYNCTTFFLFVCHMPFDMDDMLVYKKPYSWVETMVSYISYMPNIKMHFTSCIEYYWSFLH